MAADLRISRGLELFAAGDLRGAALEWLLARRELGTSPQLDTYLSFVRQAAPEAMLDAEKALAAQPIPSPEVSATRPRAEANSHPAARALLRTEPPAAWLPLPPPPPPVLDPAVMAPSPPMAPSVAPITQPPSSGAWVTPIPVPIPITPSPRVIVEPPALGLGAPLPEYGAVAAVEAQPRAAAPVPLPQPVSQSPTSMAVGPGVPTAPIELDLESLPELALPAASQEPVPSAEMAVPAANPTPAAKEPWGDTSLLGPPLVVESLSSALQLVAHQRPSQPTVAVPATELAHEEIKLRDLMGLDDFSGALKLAESLLAHDPKHVAALAARERCREKLTQMHLSRLGSLSHVPRVLIPPEQVIWLDLDHRSGFLLAQVDGISSYEDLVELSGMDRLEALRLFAQLVQKGVIGSQP